MSEETHNLTPALEAHRHQDEDACLAEVSPILTKSPHHPVALHLKAWAISRKGRSDEALKILSDVVEKNPQHASAKADYGSLLLANRRHAEALKPLREALDEQPERDELALKYGMCLLENRRFEEAESELRKLLDRRPHHFKAKYWLGVSLLHQGKWKDGFDLLRARLWMNDEDEDRHHEEAAEWKGNRIEGKKLLIETEQDFEDQVLMIRYARWVKEEYKPAKVVVLACPDMKSLLESADCVDEVVTDLGEADYDQFVALYNLPFIHRTTPDDVPFTDDAYLSVSDESRKKWAETFSEGEGEGSPKRIALCWRNNLVRGDDNGGSLNLPEAEALINQIEKKYPGAELFSLQPGGNRKMRKMLNRRKIHSLFDQPIPDFTDISAIVDKMDLVVSLDNVVAHIAGAMGRPVWNLLPQNPDWQWSGDDEYSEWYPNMKLIRRDEEGNWGNLDSE